MLTERTTKSDAGESTQTGAVAAVCYGATLVDRVKKPAHHSADVTMWGIPGDYHYGQTRMKNGEMVPNDRPITVVGAEAAEEACAALGIPDVAPGGLGENFQLKGLGDLGDLRAGDEIRFCAPGSDAPSVVLQVRKQNEPCSNLMVYHKQMPKQLYGRRGVICLVLKEGHVSIGYAAVVARRAGEQIPGFRTRIACGF